MSFTVYYASDIHGADRLWRKFVNAGKFYGADVLVMGGDITGKAVVPIIRSNGGLRVPELIGDRVAPVEELESLETQIRNRGFYPYVTTEDELAATHGDERAVADLFRRAMAQSVRRVAGAGPGATGGDRDPAVHDARQRRRAGAAGGAGRVAAARRLRGRDGGAGRVRSRCCRAGSPTPPPGTPRASCPRISWPPTWRGWWPSSTDPQRSVFNLHVPPKGTALDQAPELDATLKPVVRGGSVSMTSAGSAAVRELIERYQPLVALHGHIHESRAMTKIGRTVCINPGSEYGEGVLHGALMVLDRKKGLRTHQLVSG